MAKAKKAAKKAECTLEVLVVGSKVRAHIRDKNAKMSGELLAALNCKVGCLLNEAIERAVANKRATVKPQDL
jgi:histone H3/H4